MRKRNVVILILVPLAEQKVLVETREANKPLLIVRPAEGRGPYSVFYEESAELAPPDVAQVARLSLIEYHPNIISYWAITVTTAKTVATADRFRGN